MQIITPVMEIITNMGNGIIIALVNYYYFSCGHASNTGFVNTVAYIILTMGFFFLIGIFSSVTYPPKHVAFSKDEENETTISEKNANDTVTEIEDRVIEIEDRIFQMKEQIENIKRKQIRTQRRRAILARISIVLLACWLVIILVYEFFPLSKKEDFDRNMDLIAPYIDNIEFAHLKADWVSIETREDYVALNEKIQNIMETNDIK